MGIGVPNSQSKSFLREIEMVPMKRRALLAVPVLLSYSFLLLRPS
jgi:hypothetical protein